MPRRRVLSAQTAKTTAFLQKSLTTPRRFAILYSVAERQQTRGGVAHLGERLNGIQEVRGSIPLISTTNQQQKSVPYRARTFVALWGFWRGCGCRTAASRFACTPVPPQWCTAAPGCVARTAQPSPRMRRKLPSEARAGDFRMSMTHCVCRRLNGPTVAIKKVHTTKQVFCCIKRAYPYGTTRVRPLKGRCLRRPFSE